MRGIVESYAHLDKLTEPTLPVKYPRTPGLRPQPEENPYNAWYWRTEITGAPSGPLIGKTLAIKDNVCVAGVPMMNGSSVLEGYTPGDRCNRCHAYPGYGRYHSRKGGV